MDASLPIVDDPQLIRRPERSRLVAALQDSRARTLRTFAAYRHALGAADLSVPYRTELNPPLWEMGHVAWFQEYWIARNPQRCLGTAADPAAARTQPLLDGADRLYDSSRVEHSSRWRLPLPNAEQTLDYLQRSLEVSLRTLEVAQGDGQADLYFAWLTLMHEDMHHEAAVYMANGLGIAIDDPAPAPYAAPASDPLHVPAMRLQVGCAGDAFAFDNELQAHWVDLPAFSIDRRPVDHASFAAFVEDGGYRESRHWSAEGLRWLQRTGTQWPRFWRPAAAGEWEVCRFGRWQALCAAAPVSNLTWHEAQAWCRWAGRRLPSEFEWEAAALWQAGLEAAGDVWEWTASAFEPYPGFTPHPYRDYSAPWFGSRRVLRGGSFATHPRLRHPRYRNFFDPERNDIFAGFRSCACP